MVMNNDDMLMVTIRCIAYNHEPYIRQCLEGFVIQKTNFRFEAIVHDDASTDGTAAIIREYAEKYPDIIKPIFETENQYSKRDGSLRRIMDSHTRGKYVAMCEGDDYWIDPLKLQKQVDFLESHPDYSMCFHNAIKYYENCNRVELFNSFANDCDLSVHDAVHNWFVPTASMMMRADISLERPDWVRTIYSGDYTTILLAIMRGKIRCIHGLMSVYRINYVGTSMSAQMVKRNTFVIEQKISLLNSFLLHADGDFLLEIQSMIAFLNRELKFQLYKERKNIFGLLSLFDLLVPRLLSKVRNFVLNNK